MNEPEQPDYLPPDESVDPNQLFVEVPTHASPVPHDRIPSGYEPMGEIELRGRMASGLAGGRVPWWVLITGWVIFGGAAFLLLHVALTLSSFTAWFGVAIALLPLIALGRGTFAKWIGRDR